MVNSDVTGGEADIPNEDDIRMSALGSLSKMDRGGTDQLEEIGETREELEDLVSKEDGAIDAAMYRMEVEQEGWWDSMTIKSEDGLSDQLTESVTPAMIVGYLHFDPVMASILTQIINERHHQQNLGYTKKRDLEHEEGYLPAAAIFVLDNLRFGRLDSLELKEQSLKVAIALLIAEWERLAALGDNNAGD